MIQPNVTGFLLGAYFTSVYYKYAAPGALTRPLVAVCVPAPAAARATAPRPAGGVPPPRTLPGSCGTIVPVRCSVSACSSGTGNVGRNRGDPTTKNTILSRDHSAAIMATVAGLALFKPFGERLSYDMW